MSWFKSDLKSTFLGLLSPAGSGIQDRDGRLQQIREAMLDAMGEHGEQHHPKTVLRVRYAQDPEALWYARSDFMAVLAAENGEAEARRQIGEINALFRGLLPEALQPRTSHLARAGR